MLALRSSLKAALLALGTVVGLLECSAIAEAAIRFPFDAEEGAWNATHVVVVTEGDKIDGEVEVLESWKGDLKKGDPLSISDLAKYAPEDEREISDSAFEKRTKPPTHVTCSRMVLFLIKDHEKNDDGKASKVIWRSAASYGGMDRSTAWVEKEQVYAFTQIFNPGWHLVSWKMTEKELRAQLDTVLKTQTELAKVLGQSDAAKLSDGLLSLLKTESWFLRSAVISTAGKAGTTALPALRKVLEDDSFAWHHDEAVRAMVEAGGAAIGPELTEMLKKDLEYWKKTGPALKKDWQNGSDEKTQRLNGHYYRTYRTLCSLKELRIAGCKDAVIALRDFCRSQPHLADTYLVKECDEVLEVLRRPGPATTAP